MKIAHLRLRLKAGEKLTYKWLDRPSHDGNYDDIRQALLHLLGPKLKA